MDSLYNTNSQNFSNNTHQSFHDESTRYNNQTVQYQQTQDNYYQHDQYNYYYQTSYENYNNTQYSNYYYNNQTADFQSNMNYQYQYQSSNGYQTENNESNMMHFQHNSTTQYNYYQYAQHDQQSTQQYEIQAPIVINTINDNMNTEEICGVCENNKDVKFVYGGYLDEACLKFFQRCVKNEEKGKRFICKKDGYCIVTGDQRTKCGACRYNKCLSLGLSKTNRGYKITESIVRPCEICNGVSSGVHFGAFTCEACKVNFFIVFICLLFLY